MINVKNIYKNYGALNVLKGVSCEIKDGEKVAIIGPSGSGKSTLLRCMNLLEEPTLGEIWLDDDLLTGTDPYLHEDIIKTSYTYQSMIKKGVNEEEALAKLPGKDALIVQLIWTLQGNVRNLAYALNAIKEKMEA